MVGAVIALLAALIAPAIQQARIAAWNSTSKNNLKQLGIAFHNYHETFDSFPPGGTFNKNGVALHGWYTKIMPFMDAGRHYDMVNFDYPWTDSENLHIFRAKIPYVLMPSVTEAFTSDGFGLIHYFGNPNMLHRNSSVKLEDMQAGAAKTWLLGEVEGNYHPWGYPFNWRPLGSQLNAGPDSYGRPTEDGAFFLMGDGSVQQLSNDVDPSLLRTMASAPPIAPAERTQVPTGMFKCVATTDESHKTLEFDENDGEDYIAIVRYNPTETLYSVWFFSMEKEVPRLVSLEELNRVVREFPQAKQMIGPIALNDEAAQYLSKLRQLELLRVRSVELSQNGIQALSQLPTLRIIRGSMTEEMQKILVKELPKCDIRKSPTYY